MKTIIPIFLTAWFLFSSFIPIPSPGTEAMLNFNDSIFTSGETTDFIISRFSLPDEDYIDDIPWDTKKILSERLRYPDNLGKKREEGSVLVTFRYNDMGYIEVLRAISNSRALQKYVSDTLKSIKLTYGIVDIHKEYTIRFDFRLI
jgi:hypothetical protein